MTDNEFTAHQVAKIDKRRRNLLRKVHNTGEIGNNQAETLWYAGLIQFGGPRPEIANLYNCYRLTDEGEADLATGAVCSDVPTLKD